MRLMAGLWSDMFIESTLMRYGHARVGITLKAKKLKTWDSVEMYVVSKLRTSLKLEDYLTKIDISHITKKLLHAFSMTETTEMD